MKINLKLRFKNKVVLTALIATVATFVYDILSIVGITPAVTEGQVMEFVEIILTVLVAIGVLTDPTTEGLGDSEQAMMYEEPK